mmetsp:Transcript_90460/g.260638  ORF Transcript_90460/g.260638 Transcript_90460/m.260638 type:complete len:98 (-) Transcript_90460:279-572(-)
MLPTSQQRWLKKPLVQEVNYQQVRTCQFQLKLHQSISTTAQMEMSTTLPRKVRKQLYHLNRHVHLLCTCCLMILGKATVIFPDKMKMQIGWLQMFYA